MNIHVRRTMHLKRGERYEDMIDHVSYRKHDIKTFQLHTGFSLHRLSPRVQETHPVQRHIDLSRNVKQQQSPSHTLLGSSRNASPPLVGEKRCVTTLITAD